jgi:hypothetical protein
LTANMNTRSELVAGPLIPEVRLTGG